MNALHPIWFFLFFLAVAAGFIIGRSEKGWRRATPFSRRSSASAMDFGPLPDVEQEADAVSVIPVSEETCETHLALGQLFRRRGELGRAIAVHQRLLHSENLPERLKRNIRLELGRDYLSAGLYDRAEKVFRSLAESGGEHADEALRTLMLIFEIEKDWHSALVAGQQLLSSQPSVGKVLAHYCCEMATKLFQQDEHNAGRRMLERAFLYDPRCARASHLLARFEMSQGGWQAALKYLHAAQQQHPDFGNEVLTDMDRCFLQLDREEEYIQHLISYVSTSPDRRLVSVLVAKLEAQLGKDESRRFLLEYFRDNADIIEILHGEPTANDVLAASDSLAEASRLPLGHDGRVPMTVQLAQQAQTPADATSLLQFHEVHAGPYRCRQCGYITKGFSWQCTGCRGWSTLARMDDGRSLP